MSTSPQVQKIAALGRASATARAALKTLRDGLKSYGQHKDAEDINILIAHLKGAYPTPAEWVEARIEEDERKEGERK